MQIRALAHKETVWGVAVTWGVTVTRGTAPPVFSSLAYGQEELGVPSAFFHPFSGCSWPRLPAQTMSLSSPLKRVSVTREEHVNKE